MARRNGVWYEGRIINNRENSKLRKAKTGKLVLDLVIAEQFQERNDKAPDKFKDAAKAATDYVNTHTAWHKLRIYGEPDNEQMLALITNELFNHGCVVVVDASYREEEPWKDKRDVVHAGRQESIFLGADDPGTIEIKVLDDGRALGARDEYAKPFWDGVSEIPSLAGSGGGGPVAPEYSEDEGF